MIIKILKRFPSHLAGFRNVGLAFTIFSLLNLAIFATVSLWPELARALWLSANRPWGNFICVQQYQVDGGKNGRRGEGRNPRTLQEV